MKPIYIIGIIVIIAVAAFFFIRSRTEPKFEIIQLDNANKSGTFTFGGAEHMFAIGKGGDASGRNGYAVIYGSKDGQTIYFDLYKNGQLIRTLKTI